MKTFEEFKEEFKEDFKYMGDTEAAHIRADELLCEIALAAAAQKLSVEQTQELIDIYNEVEKWYA